MSTSGLDDRNQLQLAIATDRDTASLTCTEIRAQPTEASRGSADTVTAHLAGCDACRAYFSAHTCD